MNSTSGTGSHEAEIVDLRLQTVAAKLDALESKLGGADKTKSPWYSVVAQLLGIPAVLVLMFLQLNQARQAPVDIEKSQAEASKARAEELKTRGELEVILNNLQRGREAGLPEFEQRLREALPRLDSAIAALSIQSQRSTAATAVSLEALVGRCLVALVFLFAVRVVLDIYGTVIGACIAIPLTAYLSLRGPEAAISHRVVRVIQPAVLVMSQFGPVIRLAVQVTILFSVFAPLFDDHALAHGAPSFSDVFTQLGRLNLVGAIRSVQAAVTGGV